MIRRSSVTCRLPGYRRLAALLPSLALALASGGCVHAIYQSEPGLRETPPDSVVEVRTPVRAHLADGSVVLFRDGARVGPDRIEGSGWRHGLLRRDSTRVAGVGMDSVVGLEAAPRSRLNAPATLLVSAAATGVAALGASALAVAIFGSCPTVYAASGDGEVLEAELFSYSIAPLLEGRDVDALGAAARGGVVRLDVRNEALETHFINDLRLLEVSTRPGEVALPDPDGLPVVVADLSSPQAAADRDGRDVTRAVASVGGRAFETSSGRLAAAAESDLEDVLELRFPRPRPVPGARDRTSGETGADPGPDSVALVLRLRNSLLNTVLFYDLMLAGSGAEALSWMGADLQRIGPAVALGRWWSSRMGMRVEVLRAGEWEEVARLADTGPIAWTEVAVPMVPPPGEDPIAVRLRFVADAWRVDRAALAASARRAHTVAHVPTRVLDVDGQVLDGGRGAVAAPDERYLETRPGDRFIVEFDVGAAAGSGDRRFLLSSQGYYTEWIRPGWVREAAAAEGTPPAPGDPMLREAMRRWADRRPGFERTFFESRIPTS